MWFPSIISTEGTHSFSRTIFMKNHKTDSDSLNKVFTTYATNKLNKARAELGSNEVYLKQYIKQGVEQLDKDNASDKKVEEAKKHLGRFIDELILQGEPTRGNVKIRKASFDRTKKKICPLYPFC
ncbi:hypothetical protein [Hymenobacter volaticus]|uniref:Uncharacterized protein n=1 Tax=Hymenobacter volaticus TaxID=2932254 RepID=A0ABY4G884_9BACT|nr:hypothetical protein [Hymenobacter volaticus]UOQ66799.1 hypothetical protein MUN86_02435 [Hymenobacter volaticus]